MKKVISLVLALSMGSSINAEELNQSLISVDLPSADSKSSSRPKVGTPVPLRDIIQLVLENNLQLKVSRIGPQIQKERVDVEKGFFSPEHYSQWMFEDNKTQQNAQEYSATNLVNNLPTESIYTEQNWRGKTGIRGKAISGLQWDFGLNFNRLVNSINQNRQFFLPEYETSWNLHLTQPLLKGAGIQANTAGVLMAGLEVHIANREKEVLTINKVIATVNHAYDLTFAQENLKVKQQAVDVAKALLNENKVRLKVGKMSPIDVSEAEVEVSRAQEDVYQATDFLREKQVGMLRLLSMTPNHSQWTNLSIPFVEQERPTQLNQDQLYQMALEQRPDIALAKSRISVRSLGMSRAKREAMPKLDLIFNVEMGGLEDDFGSSVQDVYEDGEPKLSAGIRFSMPLGTKTERAKANVARLQHQESVLGLQHIKTELNLNIYGATQRIDTFTLRLKTSQTSLRLAKKNLDLANELLKNGQATTRSVLNAQNEKSKASSRYFASKVDLEKAYAELWALCGSLLDKNGIKVWRGTDPSLQSYDHDHSGSRYPKVDVPTRNIMIKNTIPAKNMTMKNEAPTKKMMMEKEIKMSKDVTDRRTRF